MRWFFRQGSYRVGPDFAELRDAVAWYAANLAINQTIDAKLYHGRKLYCVYHAK